MTTRNVLMVKSLTVYLDQSSYSCTYDSRMCIVTSVCLFVCLFVSVSVYCFHAFVLMKIQAEISLLCLCTVPCTDLCICIHLAAILLGLIYFVTSL